MTTSTRRRLGAGIRTAVASAAVVALALSFQSAASASPRPVSVPASSHRETGATLKPSVTLPAVKRAGFVPGIPAGATERNPAAVKAALAHARSSAPAAAGTTSAATSAKTLTWQGGTTYGTTSNAGVIEGTPKVYLVFWGNQWGTRTTDAQGYLKFSNDPYGAAAAAQGLFKGIGTNGEQWSNVMTQYCDGSTVATNATTCPATATRIGYPTGGALAGVWYDNAAAQPQNATMAQLSSEAINAANHFGNGTAVANRSVQYIILSPTGSNPDGFDTASWCAWHSASAAVNGTSNFYIAYTNEPYTTDRNNCGKDFVNPNGILDGYTITLGHEYAETLTDTYNDTGWFTPSATDGGENGDHCIWIAQGQGASANVAFSTGTYAMQSTWSNADNNCELSDPAVSNSGAANTVTVTNPGSQGGTAGTAASLQVAAQDSASAALTYAAFGLPTGLAINTSSGLISGTPTASGTYSVLVRASDASGASGSTSWTWTVNAKPGGNTVTVTNPGNVSGTVGTAVSMQISASDSAPFATLTYSASLPPGLTVNTSTGYVSGTPTTAGNYAVYFNARDTSGAAGGASFYFTVAAQSGATGAATVTVGQVDDQASLAGRRASLQIAATDSANRVLTYRATGLPAGMRINATTGFVSGTPRVPGRYAVVVTAKDATGASGSVPFSWVVSAARS